MKLVDHQSTGVIITSGRAFGIMLFGTYRNHFNRCNRSNFGADAYTCRDSAYNWSVCWTRSHLYTIMTSRLAEHDDVIQDYVIADCVIPVNPGLHLHLKEPIVLMQEASLPHTFCDDWHSSMSMQLLLLFVDASTS